MIAVDFFSSSLPMMSGAPKPAPPANEVSAEKIFEHSEIKDYEFSQGEPAGPQPLVIKIPQDTNGLEKAGPLVIHIPQPEMAGPDRDKARAISKIIEAPAQLKVRDKITALKAPRERPPAAGKPAKAVIIIDDLGMDRKRSYEAVELPGPLTLAFLPYAPKLDEITAAAQKKGHQLLIHAPMQPLDRTLDPGPLALRDSMSRADIDEALNRMFASFDGYVGINNHMGSRLTQNAEAMGWVMEALAKRNLIFVDSVTIPTSIAGKTAGDFGLRHAQRDIFLDNEDDKGVVLNNLRRLESIARRRGYAVAIGHPRDATIAALKEWLPTLGKKNITLVPVASVARRTKAMDASYGPVLP